MVLELYCLCFLTTESTWEKPDGFQGESSASAQPGQSEVKKNCSFCAFFCGFISTFFANEMLLNVNIVFVFRAPQAVLGWKLSVLRVIHITTIQRLEVKYFVMFLKISYFWTPFFILCCLIITSSSPHRDQLGEASRLSLRWSTWIWIQQRGRNSGEALDLSAGASFGRRGELQWGTGISGGCSPWTSQPAVQHPKDQLQGERSTGE